MIRQVFESQKEKCDNEVETVVEEKKKPFILINRKPEYLKKSLLRYLKEKKLESKFDELQSLYSENITSVKQTVYASKKRVIKKRKINRNNSTNTRNIRRINKEKIFRNNTVSNGKHEAIFSWPIKYNEFWLSSFFGLRRVGKNSYGFHYGLDLAALKGITVKAAASGTVIEAAYSARGYGNTIVIQHDQKYKTRYAHLNRIGVRIGDKVNRGEKIGTVGDTGLVRSKGKDPSHLHFEVYVFGKQINPLYVLQ